MRGAHVCSGKDRTFTHSSSPPMALHRKYLYVDISYFISRVRLSVSLFLVVPFVVIVVVYSLTYFVNILCLCTFSFRIYLPAHY